MRSIWHIKKKIWSQFKTENCPKQRPIFLFRDFSYRPNSPLFWDFVQGAGALENELISEWKKGRTCRGCPHKRYSNLLRALSKHIHI